MPDARGYSKRQPALIDLSVMPFGKHKGELLQEVPAPYLKWLYEEMKDTGYEELSKRISDAGLKNNDNNERLKLYNYLHNSIDAILMECGERRRA